MKRRICVVLIIAMVISLIGIGPFKTRTYADDETKQYGNLLYTVSDGSITITECDQTATEAITIPEKINNIPVTKIGDSAFANCKTITRVEVPDTVVAIGKYAFAYCNSLEQVDLSANIKEISEGTFRSCGIDTIDIPNGVTTIGSSAFLDCSSLQKLKLPNSIKCIKYRAFENCYEMSSIQLSTAIEEVGSRAFMDCKKLVKLDFPASLNTFGSRVIENCEMLEAINVDENNDAFCSIDGVLFSKDKSTLVAAPNLATGEAYEVPIETKTIGEHAFSTCNKLQKITLNNVKIIDQYSFDRCKNLEEVLLKKPIEEIRRDAFYYCTSLKKINLINGLTIIGQRAFCYCEELDNITIPKSVKTVVWGAFNGTGLKQIYFCGDAPDFGTVNVEETFRKVVAVAYYPEGNGTWTEDMMQQYGGTLTWKTWNPPADLLGVDNYSYSFANSREAFGYPQDYTIPLSSYELIYGKNVRAEDMYLRKTYSDIPNKIKRVWSGNCAGMTATSELLVDSANGVNPVNFNESAADPKDLAVKDKNTDLDIDLTTFIEAMHVAQYTQIFKNDRSATKVVTSDIQAGRNNLNDLHDQIKTETEAGRPVLLAMMCGGGIGHAILGYGVKDKDDGTSEIQIYDNRFPMEERIMTLTKDSSGNYTSWAYDMDAEGKEQYGIWGTDHSDSNLSFVYYDTIMEIWKTRGNLDESGSTNMLTINSDDFSLYSSSGQELARVENGELVKTSNDIDLMERELSLREDNDPDNVLVAPIAVYHVVNRDESVEQLEVSASNAELGASVNTTANKVVVAVQDSVNYNSVTVCADPEDTYTVSLKSTLNDDYNEIIATGVGTEEDATISMVAGVLDVEDCALSALVIDGEDQGPFTIKATAEEGGTITPNGESQIIKGEGLTYTITPNAGYAISDVLVDGKSAGAVSTYEFKNVKGAHSIVAKFERTNLYGDANGDNKVDASDLTRLARHLAKIEMITNSKQLENADVNHDGKVSSEDLTKLARYIAKIISSLD